MILLCKGKLFHFSLFADFYSEETVNNQGLECLRFLNEVISDFDAVNNLINQYRSDGFTFPLNFLFFVLFCKIN